MVKIQKIVGRFNYSHTAVPFRNYVIVNTEIGMKVLDVTLQKW